jgi:hypothetical protein
MINNASLGFSYAAREQNLRDIGFSSYSAYLESPTWKGIRRKVWRIKGSVCTLCNRTATQLHHNRYSHADLLGADFRFIHPLCEPCHKAIEFNDGTKRQLHEVKAEFERRLSEKIDRKLRGKIKKPKTPEQIAQSQRDKESHRQRKKKKALAKQEAIKIRQEKAQAALDSLIEYRRRNGIPIRK